MATDREAARSGSERASAQASRSSGPRQAAWSALRSAQTPRSLLSLFRLGEHHGAGSWRRQHLFRGGGRGGRARRGLGEDKTLLNAGWWWWFGWWAGVGVGWGGGGGGNLAVAQHQISDFRFQISDFRFQIPTPGRLGRETDFFGRFQISDLRSPRGTRSEISKGSRILNAQNTFQDFITDFCATQISDFRSQNWPDF